MMQEPKRLLKLKHYKGMPIPVTVMYDAHGVPDFASLNVGKAQELGRREKCALCGKGMQKEFAFVGGEKSIANGIFQDGPMHIDCATYSFFICPFVSGEHRVYREHERQAPEGVTTSAMPIVPVSRMGVLIVSAYTSEGTDFEHSWRIKHEWMLRVMWEEDIRAASEDEG